MNYATRHVGIHTPATFLSLSFSLSRSPLSSRSSASPFTGRRAGRRVQADITRYYAVRSLVHSLALGRKREEESLYRVDLLQARPKERPNARRQRREAERAPENVRHRVNAIHLYKYTHTHHLTLLRGPIGTILPTWSYSQPGSLALQSNTVSDKAERSVGIGMQSKLLRCFGAP